MNIHVFDQQQTLKFSLTTVKELVAATVKLEGQRCDEVSIYFVDTPTICQLHEQYFDDPSPTDCVSFPIDSEDAPYRVLGDVFVCPETAIAYATQHSADPYHEITLYVVHGLLHLMGYDDIDETDEKTMRIAEARVLRALDIQHLILCPEQGIKPLVT